MNRTMWVVFALVLAMGCGDSDEPVSEPDRYPTLPTAQPFEWSSVGVGVGVRSGEPMGIASFAPEVLPKIADTFPHAVLRVQAYDEASQAFGEYLSYPPPAMLPSRGPVDFRAGNAAAGGLAPRVADLVEEISGFGDGAGAEFAESSIVIDLWRLKRDWYVRWDGKLDDAANTTGRGPYGFYRQDFSNDLLDAIEVVAQTHKPKYMVIGTEMERLLRTAEGNGLAPSEFANFTGFYQSAVARVKRGSPETKVSFGLNWNTFVERVAPQYKVSDEEEEIQSIDLAFELTLLPLLEISDVIALSVYGTPSQDGSAYEFLRRLEGLYGLDKPIIVYELGTPVDSVVDYLVQKNFIDTFETWMAGLNVEFVAWKGMTNFDGSDTSNQVPAGRCDALTRADRGMLMPISGCYDGLVTSLFGDKEVFTYLRERLGE